MRKSNLEKYLALCALPLRISVAAAAMLLCTAVSAGAQDAAAPVELFNYPGTVLNGITSAQVPMKLEACRQLCEGRSGCQGFDHSEKNECRLFTSVVGCRSGSGSTSETRSLVPNCPGPTNPPLAVRLAKLRETDTDGHELFALSQEAFKRGDRSVGMEAINLATQRGNQDAKLEMARWYDPRTFAPDRVDGIDANKAARSYFELALEGNPKANSLLNSLCLESSDSGSNHANAYENFLRTTYCEGSINP
ncbi:PAN domain-containing protein [Mesorhizobium sp. M0142]|uniref:PAN domain-containing protein n=1 Tax=unclassified Mesorhizobium TaxID=325217 RepID=UPI0033362B33